MKPDSAPSAPPPPLPTPLVNGKTILARLLILEEDKVGLSREEKVVLDALFGDDDVRSWLKWVVTERAKGK